MDRTAAAPPRLASIVIAWAVIADDLTGCLDSTAPFVRAGRRVRAVLIPGLDSRHLKSLSGAQIVGLDCESRTLDPADAGATAAAVTDLALALGAQRIYKKIDSTLRGPWEAELNGAQKRMDGRLTILCPAVPRAGRTTIHGIQHVHGTALPGGNLVHRLGEGARNIPLDRVRQGQAAIEESLNRFRSEGISYAIIDAVDQSDLNAAAAAALASGEPAIMAGAAGFAHALADQEAPGSPPLVPVCGVPVIISASYHPTTLEQFDALKESGRAKILAVPQAILLSAAGVSWEDAESLADDWVSRMRSALAGGRVPALCVERDGEPGREDPGREDLRLAAGLGRIGAWAALKIGPSNLVICGGATTFATITPLAPDSIEIEGLAMPNIPAGRLVGGPVDGIRIITKAGGFGAKDALIKLSGGDPSARSTVSDA